MSEPRPPLSSSWKERKVKNVPHYDDGHYILVVHGHEPRTKHQRERSRNDSPSSPAGQRTPRKGQGAGSQTVGLGGYPAAAYYFPAARGGASRRPESIANCSAGFARITRFSGAASERGELQGLGPARAGVVNFWICDWFGRQFLDRRVRPFSYLQNQ